LRIKYPLFKGITMKYILSILCTFLLLGCVSTAKGPKFTPLNIQDPSLSVVYIYRPSFGYFGQGIYDVDILVNQKKVSHLAKESYIPVKLLSGKHVITSKVMGAPTVNLELDVVAGKDYYVKVSDTFGNKIVVTEHGNKLELMPTDVAKTEISSYELISSNFNSSIF
jgi:hypothetical protein